MTEKLIIHNRSGLPMETALVLCRRVVEMGRISKDGEQYCYGTTFDLPDGTRYAVYSDLNEKSDRLTVVKDPRHEPQ